MTPEMQGVAGSRDLAATAIAAASRLRARRARVLGRVFASLAIVVASAGAIGGCTASRNELGNHDNACFRVLPEALAAVHHRGDFAGERYLAPRALIVQLHNVVVPDALADASKVATCLVAFTGRFSVSDVKRGWSPTGSSGRIAIVVVRQRDLVLLATVVLGRIPPRLVFAHVFPRLH
jgi:hypothetical protein